MYYFGKPFLYKNILTLIMNLELWCEDRIYIGSMKAKMQNGNFILLVILAVLATGYPVI